MKTGVVVVIPAFNEAPSIGHVLSDLPRTEVDAVIVVDNASTDRTARIAEEAGATVVYEGRKGYGSACLRGIEAAREFDPEILVFLDGDYSDYPAQLTDLVRPIRSGTADLVIGSRMRGNLERGAMLPQARFGNWLASKLMKWGWGAGFSDLGPFRAVRLESLDRLGMQDPDFGWTVEMQVKAIEAGLACDEVPVDYRPRIGESKITGTLAGTFHASRKILGILGRYWMTKGARSYGP